MSFSWNPEAALSEHSYVERATLVSNINPLMLTQVLDFRSVFQIAILTESSATSLAMSLAESVKRNRQA